MYGDYLTYPDVRESRVERLKTVATSCFCNHCNNGHKDPYEAVLENTEVDDLNRRQKMTRCEAYPLSH